MNTNKKDEALSVYDTLKLALEALEDISSHYMSLPKKGCMALAAIEEALAHAPSVREQPAQPYPDNFIDALMYDVAKRDSEAQQTYEDAFVNGTGVMLGDKRIDPASIYKQPEPDNTYNYAKNLAEAMFKRHFASDEHYASGRVVWGVNDTVIGILTQIDNMVADMVRKPEQEPVAWVCYGSASDEKHTIDYQQEDIDAVPVGTMLYTTPPQRKPLTDEEIEFIYADTGYNDIQMFARAIEAKLKEKNTQ